MVEKEYLCNISATSVWQRKVWVKAKNPEEALDWCHDHFDELADGSFEMVDFEAGRDWWVEEERSIKSYKRG